jgi:hypothetical protein
MPPLTCAGLGIEVEHDGAAAEVCETDGVAVLIRQFEVRRGGTLLDQRLLSIEPSMPTTSPARRAIGTVRVSQKQE